eukprot:206412_1
MKSCKLTLHKNVYDGRYLSQYNFTRTIERTNKPSLQHYINKKRASFQHRYPSSNPLILQHACNVASAWQSSGIVNMLELRRELLRTRFIFDVWPQSNSYGEHQHLYNTQQPVHDVIVARFPHNLHDKYGDPSSNIISRIKDKMHNTNTSSTTKKKLKLTNDEQWNKNFWYESDIDIKEELLTSERLLNYPMPGDNHYNDADSPLTIPSTKENINTNWFVNKFKKRKRIRTDNNYISRRELNEELLYRGYVFIFSSGCVVTWGYSGRDRDWIDSFVQLYQNKKKGWPSFDGFSLPFWRTIPLYMTGDGSFLYPKDIKIARSDFLNLCFLINKKGDVNVNLKFGEELSNDIERWDLIDVQRWLNSVGLCKYCLIFEKHEIDGKMLLKIASSNRNSSSKITTGSSHHQIFIEKVLLATSSLKDYFVFIEELNKLNVNKEDIFSDDDILCLPANTDLNTLIAISYSL